MKTPLANYIAYFNRPKIYGTGYSAAARGFVAPPTVAAESTQRGTLKTRLQRLWKRFAHLSAR
jgi:hypothetical protein